MANVQPLIFTGCMRFTALATFADLSAVTVICNRAARKPCTWTLHIIIIAIKRYVCYLLIPQRATPEKHEETVFALVNDAIEYFD